MFVVRIAIKVGLIQPSLNREKIYAANDPTMIVMTVLVLTITSELYNGFIKCFS